VSNGIHTFINPAFSSLDRKAEFGVSSSKAADLYFCFLVGQFHFIAIRMKKNMM